MLDQTPTLSLNAAERLARERFGIDGRAAALPSERDQNFLIVDESGRRLVLKIANATERPAMILAQQAALSFVAPRIDVTPWVVRATNDAATVDAIDDNGRRHIAWAASWVDGRPLGLAGRKSSSLLEDIGRQTAVLDRALDGFDHPALHRDFHWDLANARAMVERFRPLIADDQLSRAIDRCIGEFEGKTAPLLDSLPKAVIHNDLNDYNILIGPDDGDMEQRQSRVTGIVDFGDLVYSYRIGDLAIATAYTLLGEDDPLGVATTMLRGFCEVLRPTEAELGALFGLIALRLCASACIAADQMRQRPDNEYLGVSQSAITRCLPILASIPFGLAEAAFRQTAGLSATRGGPEVVTYLERARMHPVLAIDPHTAPSIVLDLSVASPMIEGDLRENAEAPLTRRVFDKMAREGVALSIGRYNEPRLLYVAPAFTAGSNARDEHRTIHIGLDLFAVAGTPVFAPLDGTVHLFADNASPQDYGPVIVLKHNTDEGAEFFTLYGHLSREALRGLSVGRAVKAGEQIATLGDATVNGGWTPHLHLQVITDLLGLGTDFPGVARSSQRAAWCALCPDPNLVARVPADRFPAEAPTKSNTLAARNAHIGGNLSVAYRDPVKIVRGWMEHLYDETGRRYIDAYNNVPHVGHCHPRVVDAAARQMRILSTNTRYLNDLLSEYAARLLATLPPSLSVCYFVNSASEANELALRLTRAHTRRRDTIVLDAAYHGNTTSLIDISPYKHAGPGGEGAPDWVHAAPLPDVFRGAHRANDARAGAKYAAAVAAIVDRLMETGRRPGAFIAETCPSVGGQLIFPAGYLENVYNAVRKSGGLCIADEVQTGLGRMGTSFWAFEDQGVVPDIVVMGKPLGNGHPIGAVATTRAIAESFDNGMEYFSTFGGNTVSCAVGIAVLDVLRDEGLQAHALRTGERMLAELRSLMDRYPIVGDVRGSGLFLGVELVRDRQTLEPAGAEASFVANRMRERGVLLGTDGPFHNVVKIRPPMPFDDSDADVLVDEFERAIRQIPLKSRVPGKPVE